MQIFVTGSQADALQQFWKHWKSTPVIIYFDKYELNCTVLLCDLPVVQQVKNLLTSQGFRVQVLAPDDENKFQELRVNKPLDEVVRILNE